MGEDAGGFEELPHPLGRLSSEDGLHPRRVGILLEPRVRQHLQQPIVDHHRAADGVSQTVGEGEQICWTPTGFGLAPLEHQAVRHGGQFAPGQRLLDDQHRAGPALGVE
jgi:hypothetical protein